MNRLHDRAAELPRLITAPREQYVRQNEGRIRSLALPQNTRDEVVAVHLAAVLMADDFESIHETAVKRWEGEGNERFAAIHERHVHAAIQLRLYHLSQLAHLLPL